jgi:hypothetical protein
LSKNLGSTNVVVMSRKGTFADRFNLRTSSPIIIREDAPEAVRHGIFLLISSTGLKGFQLRRALYKALREKVPVSVKDDHLLIEEVEAALGSCRWYEVYAVVEEVHHLLASRSRPDAEQFAHLVNALLKEKGVGWELRDGKLEYRGDLTLHQALDIAQELLDGSKRTTALTELQEALRDIRRLPVPEVTGAVQHSIAALECLARDLVGDQNLTLGKLVKKYGSLMPTALANVVDKAYGFSSDEARHLREGKQIDFAEAELIVGLSASVITYLIRVESRKTTAD